MSSPSSTMRPLKRSSSNVVENADAISGSPKSKRHRGLLAQRPQKTPKAEVVVPTLQQVDARPGSAAETAREHTSQAHLVSPKIKSEEDEAKVYFTLQASIKVEVKLEEVISENVVRDRMSLIGYDTFDIKIPRDLLEVTTTRSVTSRIWGGNMRATFPKIGKGFTHGLDDFMYISLLYNPHAPRWPGSPGLIFRFVDDPGDEWPKTMRLIVRLRDNVWQYMGQYRLTAAPPLTSDEWNAQPLEVKRKWANKLSERKMDGGIRAKIVLRKRLGRDPTSQEVENAVHSNEHFHASAEEIFQACNEGRAVVRVWCMKCVGYDEDFQRRTVAGP